MFRLWGKLFNKGRMLRDTVIEKDDPATSRTARILDSLEEICYEFDLSRPIWLEVSIRDFQIHDKVKFTADNFMEEIDFDYLEIQVIEG
ncbi:hypothetical protein [Parasporobacterium paucivorans]|uniref:Uncharacterized protein n=1 Tax=Parasporobacterium paucivorans DSM 15970 TaxID=1122934 RepID=A0A1M6J994_9FIRM|nr:hypothetical protein [Parasporobacterium paucivorans]SHJ43257.1 hypothetical protein SAMN02745691_01944 [Parasporobacterium paucivorans DSM 15970]